MLLLISDANVLIDIEASGLTQALFGLDSTFAVPDVLFAEELAERHGHLLAMGLRTLTLSAATVAYAEGLAKRHRRPGSNDLLALALARQESCPLVTGDRALRNAAKEEGVSLRGTLWLVERMVDERRIDVADAERAFAHMRDAGSRLPWDQVAQLLAQLRARQ